MRRQSSIQLLLLSLTGCSWMLLFLTLTLSDYHAFKTYHASHVAAAHTTHTTPHREIDPCDLCWRVGKHDRKEALQEGEAEDDLFGIASWGARLARAVGVGGSEHLNATPTPSPPPGIAGGIGAFYYYTLHTALTSLQIRLKKAQLVAGDVQAEVAILEGKVANLHEILMNQFSPRIDPYQIDSSIVKASSVIHSTRKHKGESDPTTPAQDSVSHKSSHQENNRNTKNQIESTKFSKTTKKNKVPANDIYALLYDQSQVAQLHISPSLNPEKVKTKKESPPDVRERLYLFRERRNLLSYGDENSEKFDSNNNVNSIHRFQVNVTDSISESAGQIKTKDVNGKPIIEKEPNGVSNCPKAGRNPGVSLSVAQKDISRLVSVVIIDQGTSSSDLRPFLSKLYPGITVHLITSSSTTRHTRHLRLMVHHVTANTSIGSSYSIALDYVTTPYVFIATNTSGLSSLTSIEHLVWATEHLGVWATSGSLLSPSGRWHLGCLQVRDSHYKMTWMRRQEGTAHGCSLCHSVEGPFLAVTLVLRDLGWDVELPTAVAQLDLFSRASKIHHMLAAVCPQVMFNITHELVAPSRASLLSFAKNQGYYSIQVPSGEIFKFTCDEVSANCGVFGFALPPCCRRELARLVRFLMDTCDAHGLLCELQEGTLLGALKTGGVMPWEKDADVTFHTNNFTALGELRDVFERAGYSLHLVDNRWCCVEGRWAGGQGTLNSPHWTLELYSQHAMDSEDDLLARRPRTRVLFDGSWVTAPSSPGLYARNRYGTELYRHAQHWLDTGRKSGWEDYDPGRFLPCPRPSHHACLDEYLPDGNLNFRPLCLP